MAKNSAQRPSRSSHPASGVRKRARLTSADLDKVFGGAQDDEVDNTVVDTPVDPAPVDAQPVDPAPADPAPVDPAPVEYAEPAPAPAGTHTETLDDGTSYVAQNDDPFLTQAAVEGREVNVPNAVLTGDPAALGHTAYPTFDGEPTAAAPTVDAPGLVQEPGVGNHFELLPNGGTYLAQNDDPFLTAASVEGREVNVPNAVLTGDPQAVGHMPFAAPNVDGVPTAGASPWEHGDPSSALRASDLSPHVVGGVDLSQHNLPAEQLETLRAHLAGQPVDDGKLGAIPNNVWAHLQAAENGGTFDLARREGFSPAKLPSLPTPALPPGMFATNVPGTVISAQNPALGPLPDGSPASIFMQGAGLPGAQPAAGAPTDLASALRLGQTFNPLINAGQRIASTWTGHDPKAYAPWLAQVGVGLGVAADVAEGKNPLDSIIKNEDKAMLAVYGANATQTVMAGLQVVKDLGPTASKLIPSLGGTATAIGVLGLSNYTPAGDVIKDMADAGLVILPAFAGGPMGSAVVTGMMRQAIGHGYAMTETRINDLDKGMRELAAAPDTPPEMRQAVEYARQTGDYRDMVQVGKDKEGAPVLLYGKSPNEWSPWQLAVERVRHDEAVAASPSGQIAGPATEPNPAAVAAWQRLEMRYAEDNGFLGRARVPAVINSHSFHTGDLQRIDPTGNYAALARAHQAAVADYRAKGIDLLQHYGYVKK